MASNSSGTPVEQVRAQPCDRQSEPLAVGARERERVRAEVAAGHDQIGTLVLQRERDRAAAGTDVEHARARAAARAPTSTSSSVSGRGISARRSTASSSRRKPRRPTM